MKTWLGIAAAIAVAFVGLDSFALGAAERADELSMCPPKWPTHCPSSPAGKCFAKGVSCSTVRQCHPEGFARACPAGQKVVCWAKPKDGNYGDCQ